MHSLELSDNIAPMDDPKWLRLITIGLVLAAVAVGYFLFTGRFSSTNISKKTQVNQASPSASFSPSPTSASAFNRIAERTAAQDIQPVTALPRTGFPAGLIASFSISTLIIGWGLRRFPR